MMLLKKRDLEWVPDEGVLVPLGIWLYGDLRSGFKYEVRRK